MRVLFHANTLNYRGTTVAVTDYARYNQEILGNESVIVYNDSLGYDKDMGSEQVVVDNLKKSFNVIGYKEGDLEGVIEKEGIDTAYFIRAGNKEPLPNNVKTAVHAVFQFNEPHGDKYAYISEWLSKEMSGGRIPFVPHIVNLPKPTKTFREHLGIRPDQKVIGRIGGYFTFDIPYVKNLIEQLVTQTDEFVFLFVGTDPFISHPNVMFINEIHDVQKKANFIETCDAMLHARSRGESFGISIAEFLSFNKPVFAWNNGYDRNHLDMLKNSGTLYNNSIELKQMLSCLDSFAKSEDWSKRVSEFKPESVMKKFKDVFL
jgi:glycosyltransferase involved in cell wall biosynthesis